MSTQVNNDVAVSDAKRRALIASLLCPSVEVSAMAKDSAVLLAESWLTLDYKAQAQVYALVTGEIIAKDHTVS